MGLERRLLLKAGVPSIAGPLLAVTGTLYIGPAVGILLGVAPAFLAVIVLMNELENFKLEYSTALDSLLQGQLSIGDRIDKNIREKLSRIFHLIEKAELTAQDTSTVAIQGLIGEIKDSMTKAKKALENISTAGVHGIDLNLEELSEKPEEEHSILVELGDYIQTLTAGIEEMNTQAQALKEYALETATMAEKGKEISDNVALNVASISEVNREMEQAISNLVEQSRKVGEIVEVIGNIADQTNLLALNASIEAARSGEYGRGFAVVAENIRELADQAKKSTEQIAALIINMQHSIDTVVESIQREFSVTSEIKDAVQELIAAFDDIARRANETAGMIKDLSESIDGQAQSVQMIIDTMDTVHQLHGSVSDQLSGFVDSLREISNNIENMQNALIQIAELLDTSLSKLGRMEEVIR